MEKPTYAKGLEGVVAAESSICQIDGQNGKLYYRGYSIDDIVQNCTFEEVTYLLLYEHLPTRDDLESFSNKMRKSRDIVDPIKNMIRHIKGFQLQNDRTTFSLGIGFVYASGQPITTTSSLYVTRQLPDQDFYHGYNLYPTDRNSFRLPPYIRLDISLKMEKKYKSWTLAPYLQIFNIGNRKNVWFIAYNDEFKDGKITQDIKNFSMLPILPTIGVTATF